MIPISTGIIAGQKYAKGEVPITFGSLVNFEENPAGSWRLTATGANGGGKSALSLPGDGYIKSDVTDDTGTLNNLNIGVGFALSNSLTLDYAYDYLLYIEGANGNYKTYDTTDGYVDSGILAVTGDKLRTRRAGSTLYAEYLRGSTWTAIRTFTPTTSATLYIYGSAYDIGQIEYIVNPMAFGAV